MKLLALIIGCAPFLAHSIELEKLIRKDERNGPTTKDKKDKGGDKKSKFDPK